MTRIVVYDTETTGLPLQNAHSALADVHGCMAVWFAIQYLQASERAAA